MFVTTTIDGNEQIYPVAFEFGDEENDQSWTWFLTKLHNVIGFALDLMIISDRHISINNAIREVFSLVSHSLCRFHMKQNVINSFKNDKVATLFDHVPRVYHSSEFDNQKKKLKKIHKKEY